MKTIAQATEDVITAARAAARNLRHAGGNLGAWHTRETLRALVAAVDQLEALEREEVSTMAKIKLPETGPKTARPKLPKLHKPAPHKGGK